MTAHLLVLSIGPVQDFIAAARRTRDLWFGSFLLSEISKAAARAVHKAKGQLIFPAPNHSADLNEDSDFNVANIILAELPPDLTPTQVRQAAYDAAQACWKRHAQTAKDTAGPLLNEMTWNQQIDDIIEFYAAWVPLVSSYQEARVRVMRLLAGRKACRNFLPANGQALVPKSSLDGARETVLICGRNQPETRMLRSNFLQKGENKELAQRLRLLAGEELDIIGFTKRAATKEPFPSVTRVAADPWIRGIEKQSEKALARLQQIAQKCRGAAFATGTGKRHYQRIFPYDGAILYPSRLTSMMRPSKNSEQDFGEFSPLLSQEDQKTLEDIKARLEELQKPAPKGLGCGEPDPYLAVLVADGDYMGKAISAIKSADEHQAFSRQLAHFAGKASEIVTSHHGCLVYSGGDDVLAFVPVDQCLPCARQLHERFGQLTEHWKDADGHLPTLSVGIAIAHSLDPLEDLLFHARNAEKKAKHPDRNGLAVHLHPRSGVPIELRRQWTEDENKALDKRLQRWADLHFHNLIPDKAAYDLRLLLRDYSEWPTETKEQCDTLTEALRCDALQMLKRKRGRKGDEGLDKLEALLQSIKSLADAHQVVEEILVARRIADVRRQAEGSSQAGTIV